MVPWLKILLLLLFICICKTVDNVNIPIGANDIP